MWGVEITVENIPKADKLFDELLKELKAEGAI